MLALLREQLTACGSSLRRRLIGPRRMNGDFRNPMNPIVHLFVIVALAGCSGSSPTSQGSASTGTGGPATGDQACADYAAQYCAWEERCSSSNLNLVYGDVAACEEQLKVQCHRVIDAKGSTETPARTEACSMALAAL